MLARISANYHWGKMTSGVCLLVSTRYLTKGNTLYVNFFVAIIVTYLVFHNKLCQYIYEINQFEHRTNINTNTYKPSIHTRIYHRNFNFAQYPQNKEY